MSKFKNVQLENEVFDNITTAFIDWSIRKNISDDITNDCLSRFIINRVLNDNINKIVNWYEFRNVKNFKRLLIDYIITEGDELHEIAAGFVDEVDCERWINKNYSAVELIREALSGKDITEIWTEAFENNEAEYFVDLEGDAYCLKYHLEEYNEDALRILEFDDEFDYFKLIHYFLESEEYKEAKGRLYTIGYNVDVDEISRWLYLDEIRPLTKEI